MSDGVPQDIRLRMNAKYVAEQLDDLIDELLNEADVRSSSLVSMLTAVRESVLDGYHVALARRVWDASNVLKDRYQELVPVSETALPVSSSAVD